MFFFSARPRDLKTSNNTSTDNPLYQDFRFKGYPAEGFFNPHNPQYKRNSAAEMNGTDTSRYFGKTQHFDTGNASYIFNYGHKQNVIHVDGTKGFVR